MANAANPRVPRAGRRQGIASRDHGHSTISMTLDTYSHAVPAMQKDAAAKVTALVMGL